MADTIKKIIEVEIQSDQARQESARLTAQLAKLRDEQAALTKGLKAANAEYGANSEEAKRAGDALAQNRRQVAQTAAEIRKFNKELDTNSNSLNAARMKLAALNKEFDNIDQSAPDATKQVAALTAQIEDLTGAITAQEQATGRFQRNVGNYAGGIKEAFGKGGLGGALDAAKGGLMAIPQLAAAAFAFDAVRQGVQAIEELNKRIRETQTAVTQLTGAQGAELETQTAMVQALANTYGKDFKETLIATNAVSKQLGVSFTEALTQIERGFRNGGDANGEFLDQLREYPAVFRGAGISAQEFIDITTQAAKEGIYSDKGIDALKEGALTLTRDLTPAAEKALTAIGLSGKELQAQIKSGELSTFEALQKVSNQLATLNPASKEYGNVVSEVFRGAGEDAGQFVAQLGKIKVGFEDTSEQAKQTGLIFQNELKLERLTQQFGDATKGIGKLVAELKGFSLDIAADFVRGIEVVTGYGEAVQKTGEAAKATGKSFFLLLKERMEAKKAAKEQERTELALLGLSKAQIEEIKKQKANTEQLTAIAAKYGITLEDVTKLTKEDTAARKANNEAISDGTSLLDQQAQAEYRAQQAILNAQAKTVRSEIAPRDFSIDPGDGAPATPDIGNARVQLAAETERQIQDAQLAIQKEGNDAKLAQAAEYAQAAGQIASGLSNLYSALEAKQLAEAGDNEAKKLEIQKKFAKRQAAIQIVQAIIDGFVGAQKTYSTLGLPAAIPFLIAGGIGTALNVAAIATNASKFAEGGYTGPGSGRADSTGFKPAGIVHENEWVAPERMVQSPTFGPTIAALESARKGFAVGGFTTPQIGASASVMAGDPFAAAMRSALASLPTPVVAVSEINAVQNRVAVKEMSATL